MNPSREELFLLANQCRLGTYHLDDGFIIDALIAFYNLAFAAGQADQRERDAGICDKLEQQTGGALFGIAAKAVRSQSND